MLLLNSIMTIALLVNLGTHGEVYPIVEPDLQDQINQALSEVDYSKVKEDISNSIRESYRAGFYLPAVKEHTKRIMGFQYTVLDDFIVNGNVVARKGDVINLLDRVKLKTKYLFIKENQFPLFLSLVKKDQSIAAVIVEGDAYPLIEKYPKYQIYLGNQKLVDMFMLTGVPSLVYQGLIEQATADISTGKLVKKDVQQMIIEEIPYVTE